MALHRERRSCRFDAIMEFAELQEFADLKLKNYSSGMHVRLAFSVMIQVDADILLVDEVLAVGDAAFQQKCFDEFHRLRDEGKTLVFVTHDMAAVKRFCDRALLLERGEMKIIGEPERVGNHYLEMNFGRDQTDSVSSEEGERFGDQAAQIVDAWFEDFAGNHTAQLSKDTNIRSVYGSNSFRRSTTQLLRFSLRMNNGTRYLQFPVKTANSRTDRYSAGDQVIFSITFENFFAPSRIYVTPWLVYDGATALIDRRPRFISAVATATRNSGGVVDLPAKMASEVVESSTSYERQS